MMNNVTFRSFVRNGNTFFAKLRFPTSENPAREITFRCKLTDNQMPNSESILRNIARRWERIPVQNRQLKKFQIPADAVKAVNIDANLPAESEYFVNGMLNYSLASASMARGDLTAFGFSGGSAKALSELGVISVISSSLNIKPDVISGTSGGSIVAAMLAFNPDPEAVIKLLYKLVQKYSWTELLDIDLSGLTTPKSYTGFLKGKKIIDTIAREFELTGKTFSQTQKQLFITSTDLNSGREMVFCDPARTYDALIEDPREVESSIDQKYVPNLSQVDSKVMGAVERSIRMPAIFSVLAGEENGTYFAFSDGGELDNNSSRMLLSCMDVGKIIMVDLGYMNQSKGLFSNKNFVPVLVQAIDIMQSAQRNGLNDPRGKEDVTVRVINPGLFDVNGFESYARAQDIILSGKDSARHIMSALSSVSNDPIVRKTIWYRDWDKQTIDAIEDKKENEHGEKKNIMPVKRIGGPGSNVYYTMENRMSVKRYGGPGSNIYYIMEKNSLLSRPKDLDEEKEKEGQADTKKPGIWDIVKFSSKLASSLIIGGAINLIKKKWNPPISQIQ